MLDINGIELQVGDDVVYTNRNLNDLQKGKIHRIAKTRLIMKYHEDGAPLTYGNPPQIYIAKFEHIITSPSQIMKLG